MTSGQAIAFSLHHSLLIFFVNCLPKNKYENRQTGWIRILHKCLYIFTCYLPNSICYGWPGLFNVSNALFVSPIVLVSDSATTLRPACSLACDSFHTTEHNNSLMIGILCSRCWHYLYPKKLDTFDLSSCVSRIEYILFYTNEGKAWYL